MKYALSFLELDVEIRVLGGDIVLILCGGRAHIGCVVLAEPRPSLTGTGTSCTSSVLNRAGHKDEAVCRYLAEKVCAALGRTVVCTGGIHIDNITRENLSELENALPEIAERILAEIPR